MYDVLINLLTIAAMLFGLFFLFVGAFGLWRLPDLYTRMHAASKCVTLGICGVLIAGILHLTLRDGLDALGVMTKAVLVILFQFVAAPVASHMLSRAAHLDGAPPRAGTPDELVADGSGGDRPAA